MVADKVVLFIDYQNCYRRARDAFHNHETDPHWCGQIDPGALGRLIVDRSPFDRELQEVRVYRGMPVNARDPKAHAAARSQVARWESDKRTKVSVITRPLRYPYGWPDSHTPGEKPGEKGIDVALAVDFAAMAVRGEMEVGILLSVDTDLKPALEFVMAPDVAARAEVAAWDGPNVEHKRSLSVGGGRRIFTHWLDQEDFDKVKDEEDYSYKPTLRPAPASGPFPGHWLPPRHS